MNRKTRTTKEEKFLEEGAELDHLGCMGGGDGTNKQPREWHKQPARGQGGQMYHSKCTPRTGSRATVRGTVNVTD